MGIRQNGERGVPRSLAEGLGTGPQHGFRPRWSGPGFPGGRPSFWLWSWVFLFNWLVFPVSSPGASFTLAWDPNQEPDLAGYKLYYGTSSRSYQQNMDVGNLTQYTLTGLQDGVTYYFAVTAYDTEGNESGYSNEVSARNNLPPQASASSSPGSGHAPLTVSFQGNGTDQDGTIVSYSWDFGDGASSNLQNPSHTFTTAGTFTARLTISDNDGATASATVQINVLPPNLPPTLSISAAPLSGQAPLNVSFSSSASDSDGSIASYSWDFGDGGSSSQANPSHLYNSAGQYTARLTVRDDDGATASASVQITVTAPNQPPSANLTATPTSGHAPLTVAFVGSGTDPDGTVTSYSWAFGDGLGSTQQSPTHTYSTAGTYTATLTVRDDAGATASKSIQITVQPPNQPPSLTAEASPLRGAPPLTVSFTASASDPDGQIVSVLWDFGDGTTDTRLVTQHTYSVEGTFTALVQVRDDDGATQSKSFTIRVNTAPSPPKGLKLSRKE